MRLHAIYAPEFTTRKQVAIHAAAECLVTPRRAARVRAKESEMDIAMVGLAVAFFALSFAYVRLCEKL